jgi:hypothetical protein
MIMHWLGAGLITAALLAGKSPPAPTPCPYLQQQPSQKKAPTIDPKTLEEDTLSQLTRLMEARKKYEEAEDYRKGGGLIHFIRLVGLYQEAQELAPGSRFDHMAAERLEELHMLPVPRDVEEFWAEMAKESNGACALPPKDETSTQANTPSSQLTCPYLRKGMEKKSPTLKPTTNAQETLEEITRLLEARDLIIPVSSKDDNDEASELPPPLDVHEDEALLVPPLPELDPKIVEALEKVLADCPDPLSARLVVLDVTQLDEKQGTDNKQEDPPVDGWAVGVPAVEIPSLLEELDDTDSSARTEEEEDNGDAPLPDLGRVLGEVVDSIREGACVDLDSAAEQGLRAQVEMQIGGVDFKLLYDESGIHCAVVRLLPEACPDLRARQRAANDAFIEWITLGSGSGDYAAPRQKNEERPDLRDEDDEEPELES